MSFYGNIKNSARTQFYFDRIYPNRKAMDSNAAEDGIFAGRYVLVEYEQDISADVFPQAFYFNGKMYSELLTINVKNAKDPEDVYVAAIGGADAAEIHPEDIQDGDIYCIPAGQFYQLNTSTTMYIQFTDSRGAFNQITGNTYKMWKEQNKGFEDPNVFLVNGTDIYTEKPFITGQCAAIPVTQNYFVSTTSEYRKAKKVDDRAVQWTILSQDDSIFVRNWNIDKSAYENRTFDSTVWQKVYVGNVEQYIMIADLNTIAPRFTFTADAPTTTPVPIHYDAVNTNTNYNIHMQTPWGFRVKSANGKLKMPMINHKGQIDDSLPQVDATEAFDINYPSDFSVQWKGSFYDLDTEQGKQKFYSPHSGKWNGKEFNTSSYVPGAIYVNRKGFNPEYVCKSSDLINPNMFGYDSEVNFPVYDKISIEPTGYSGRVYNNHLTDEGRIPLPDTQEFIFMLPSIGDAISDIWDTVYGGRSTNGDIAMTHKRNMDIFWEYANGIVKKEGLRAVMDGNGHFNTKAVNTLAGCINSVHDLMGQIIVKDADQLNIEDYEEGYVYHFSDGSYRRKGVEYVYTKSDYTYTQISLSDTTYAKGEYYVKNGSNYTVCMDDNFDSSKVYYYKTVTIPEKYEVIKLQAKPTTALYYKTPSGIAGKPDYRIVSELTEDIDYYSFSKANEVKVTAFYGPFMFYYWDGVKKSFILDTEPKGTEDRAYLNLKDFSQVNLALKERYLYNPETDLYMSTEMDPVTGNSVEKPLTYIYCPGVFYHYSEEPKFNEDGTPKLDKDGNPEIAKTVRLETRSYEEIYASEGEEGLKNNYRIIWAKPVEGGGGDWVMNPDGSYTTSSGVTNLDVDQMFKVQFIPFRDNTYYYQGEKIVENPSDNSDLEFEEDENTQVPEEDEVIIPEEDFENNPLATTHVLEYKLVTEENLKQLYEKEFTGSENTAVFTDFYTLDLDDAGTFYAKDTFYYQTADGSYAIDKNEEMTEDRKYFESIEMILKPGMKFYIPNKYYIIDSTSGKYVLDKSKEFDSTKTYYKFNGSLYVIKDSMNIFAPHSEWNENITQVPASVDVGTRTEVICSKKLDSFARQLNTIHGLILQVNKMLEINNFDTRDRETLQGCINIVNDIINKFELLEPNNFLIVDNYGRANSAHWDTLQKTSSTKTKASNATAKDLAEGVDQYKFREVSSVDNMRGQWLTLYMNSTPKGPMFRVHHNFQKVTDTTSAVNKNTDNEASTKATDKIDLYTPIVDAMGHVVGKNTETVTLPYGFKTIMSNGSVDSAMQLDVSNPDIVAENTQDTLHINVGNKWIRTAATEGSDTLTFAHTLSPISSKANTKYGLVQDETINLLDSDNTFEVPVFQFDEAGHIIFAETHTVTIPEVFENISIAGNSTNTADTTGDDTGTVSADALTDTLNLAAGNRWIQMSHNVDTDTITFKHYVKKFTETTGSTDLDSSNTFTVQELAWDNAGHLTSSKKRTYTLQDGYKQVGVANSGANTTSTVAAAAGTLTAATQVDKFTMDTGNRWIILTADETNKKVTISHAAPGTASTSKGDTEAQTPNFGATFKVLSAGIDQTGHVKSLEEHTVKIPLPSLTDTDTGNVVTGLSLTASTGAFTLSKKNVGTLALTGYTAPTTNEVKTLANTDTINGAFSKVQSYLNSLTARIDGLDLTDTAKDGEFVSAVNQTNGKIAVSRVALAPSITITDGTSSAAPKVNVTVNSKSGTAQALTIATTGLYGVTKLSSATNSTAENVAATPKAVKAAYDLANGAVAKTATFEYDLTKVETYKTELAALTEAKLTIEQLTKKVATLEARIATLEA